MDFFELLFAVVLLWVMWEFFHMVEANEQLERERMKELNARREQVKDSLTINEEK